MPTYQVVRCASDSCKKFQSQQEKKANKWTCVVCGLKQSLQRVYFQSTAPKECRTAVMELNMGRGQADMAKAQRMEAVSVALQHAGAASATTDTRDPPFARPQAGLTSLAAPTKSRWDEYTEDPPADAAGSSPRSADTEPGLDRFNRVVVGRAEQGANTAPKRAGSTPQNPRPAQRQRMGRKPPASAPTRPNLDLQKQTLEAAAPPPPPLSAPSARHTLSQALATLAKPTQPAPAAQGAVDTRAPPDREPAGQDGASRWDCYASDSGSASE
ncbi:hypothetical protein H4R21_001230 [Coemansia helicoidea]|uniref:Uncharacterized protein n=1 Tax=Coemansia helicoidea TaxID=1286919 RepID=A0ACC1LCS7_9FUNG|nr:hypothetical protein H4R21_001230 [Coemansia helicoidea]